MKILTLLDEIPRLPGSGTASRCFCIMRELSKKHSFTLLTTAETFSDQIPALESLGIKVVRVPPGPSNEGPMVFRTLRKNYYMEALDSVLFQRPREIRKSEAARLHMAGKIIEHLKEGYDLMEVGHSWCARWIEGLKIDIPKVLIMHNVVSLLYRRMFEHKRLKMARLEALVSWWKMTKYEKRAVRRFDKCVVLSQNELKALHALVPECDAAIVPNGVDINYFKPMESVPLEPNSLVFTGTMSWLPNEDAVLWFCREVLPLIRKDYPDVKLYIVGPEPQPVITALHDGRRIIIDSKTGDARSYIARAAVYVVPIRLGAGTRVKILEAQAMGKAVVSTSVGCEGLEVTDGEDILIGDNPHKFAECVCRVLRDGALAESLGRSGRDLVCGKYDYKILASQMDRVYEDAVLGR